MRRPSLRVVAVVVGLGVGAGPLPVSAFDGGHAAPEAEDGQDPRKLYAEGESLYRRGRFREALEKFELAYDLSEQPLLLYNIALTYRQLYDVADDVEELRRGRAVLKNFMLFAQRDPELDATGAKELLAEVEQLIEEWEAEHPKRDPEQLPGPGPGPIDTPATPSGADPGRPFRIGGAVAMGVGGGLLVGGIVGAVFNAIKGQEFTSELDRLIAERPDDCTGDEMTDSLECRQNTVDQDTARNNGRKANVNVGLSLGIGGGLGLIGIVAGVLVFVQGNKRTKEWKAGASRPRAIVRPTLTPRGIGLSGRF